MENKSAEVGRRKKLELSKSQIKVRLEKVKDYLKNKWRGLEINPEFRECFPCVTSPLHFFLLDRLPILRWARSYYLPFAVRDLIAGLTVGLMVLPQALAYARIAGLPLQYGLYSSFIGCFIYFIFGSSKDITLGPTAIMCTLVAHCAAKVQDKSMIVCYMISLSLISGMVQFGLGVFNLGFVVEFISFPVINGFTSAAAITIAVGQIHTWLGINLGGTNYTIGHSFLDNVYGDFRYITYFTPSDLICGLVCMIILFSLKQMKNVMEEWRAVSISSPVYFVLRQVLWLVTTARNAVVVVGAGLLAYSMQLADLNYLTLVHDLEPGLPEFKLPVLNATVVSDLGLGIILVPLIGILESIAIAKAFARKNNYRINANQEILTLGLANLLGSFFQAFPVTGSFSRTAVNSQSGVATQAGGVYTGVLVILALSFMTPAFCYIPTSSLAAIIIAAVLPMVDLRVPLRLIRVYPVDLLWWLTSFLGTLFVGLELGVLIACAASLLPVLYRMLRPPLLIRREPPEAICVEVLAGLTFPGPDYMRRLVLEKQEEYAVSHVKLDFTAVSEIDYTVLQGLEELATELNSQGVELHIINPQPYIFKCLKQAKLKHLDVQPTRTDFARSCFTDLNPALNLSKIHQPSYNTLP